MRKGLMTAVLIAALGVGGCSGSKDSPVGTNSEDRAVSQAPEAPAVDAVPVSDSQIPAGLVQDLEEGLPKDPVGAASSFAEFSEDELRVGLPVGSEVEVHVETWLPQPAGDSGVVGLTVTTPGGGVADYFAVVLLEDDQWKVLATFAVEEGESR